MDSTCIRRRIAVATSSRADYSHLYWPLRELQARKNIETLLFVTGAHLSPEFGLTVREIEQDGFQIAERIECLLSSDTDAAMGKTLGLATMLFTDALSRHRPDLLLLIADRYEMLAPAMAALTLRIPIAHIEGGERSEGAIDQQVRDALTMLSHLHLVTTEQAKRRMTAMGEEPWRIHRVGAASLDHLVRSEPMPRDALERVLGLRLRAPVAIVGLHPVTIECDTTVEMDEVFAALESMKPLTFVFCFPNADAGSRRIVDRARAFCDGRERAKLFINLDRDTYWSLLRCADLMLGNSSSGIMESPSLALPAINIGLRQQGRQRAANIIDVPASSPQISYAVERAMSDDFRAVARSVQNPYGDGLTAQRIADLLGTVPLDRHVLMKRCEPGNRQTE